MDNQPTLEQLVAFEFEIAELFNSGKIRALVHLSGGNEKQLIEIFKQIRPQDWVAYGSVYLVTNKTNGKRYVGQTTNPEPVKRWNSHVRSSKGTHKTTPFHNAIRKYGEDGFTFEILCSCKTKKVLDKVEDFFIQKYKAFVPFGYNLRQGGSNGKATEALSAKMSKIRRKPSVVARMRAAGIAIMADPEVQLRHKAALAIAFAKPEVREKLRKQALASHADPEFKEKHRAALIAANAKPEVKARRSKAATEAHARPDVKARVCAANKAAVQREEARAIASARLIAARADPVKEAKRVAALKATLARPEVKALKSKIKKEWWAKRKAEQEAGGRNELD